MEKLLRIWPAYAPAAFFVSLALAMRTLWGPLPTRITVWLGRVVFAAMGIIWELTTDSPFWVRVVNGLFAAFVVSIGFSKILEAICTTPPATPSDSRSGS